MLNRSDIKRLIHRYTSTRKQKIIAIVSVACILALLLINLNFGNTYANDDKNQLAKVQLSNLEETVTAQGKLEPKEYVDVGTQVSGQVKKLYFDLGAKVTKGELIAEIDPRVYQTQAQAAQAKISSLQAQYVEQQAQLLAAQQKNDRNGRLIKLNAISKEALETTTASYKSAEAKLLSLNAQIQEAKSTLEGVKTNLSYTKIYAPISGTIVSQTAREGQTLNANQSAPIILQLANLNVMTVRAQVSEADVMRLKPHMPVYFTTLGKLEQRWSSTIQQILPAPEVVNDVVLYSVLIDVDNRNHELMTGMSTQVFFIIGEAKNVLTIPIEALGKHIPSADSKQGQAYNVRYLHDGDITEKMIYVGLMNRTYVEVRSGLKLNDEVLIPTKTITRVNGKHFARGPSL